MNAKLLYIEDDIDLGHVTKQYLELMKFDVTWCVSGKSGYKAYLGNTYNLIIIDIQLPDINGFELAKKITTHDKNAYFIFLTARKEKKDRISGLETGAVDYITKPFDIDELVLRIRNIIQHQQSNNLHIPHSDTDSIQMGDAILNKKLLSLTVANHSRTSLTVREAELLEYLYNKRNTIVKREEILVNIWGENDYFLGRSLDVFISRLRKLLNHSRYIKIENVYGVGFILSVPD